MDSLPPCGHHDCSLSVIHTGSCSAKWDFPGDYSLSVTRSHVFVFVVDGVCERTICNKAACFFWGACVC